MSTYPEAEKWSAAAEQREVIDSFLEWLTSQEIELCGFHPANGYNPIDKTTDRLLYSYLGIDANKLDKERRDMLSGIKTVELP